MGIHYANADLIGDGALDGTKPELLIYEQKDGQLILVGVEFLVLAAQWDDPAAGHAPGAPVLQGQLFNFVGAPNRYGLDAFYELHVGRGSTTRTAHSPTSTRPRRVTSTPSRHVRDEPRAGLVAFADRERVETTRSDWRSAFAWLQRSRRGAAGTFGKPMSARWPYSNRPRF